MDERPNTMISIIGFNKYTEQLNGRVAMIAIVIIFFIELIFKIKLTKIIFGC